MVLLVKSKLAANVDMIVGGRTFQIGLPRSRCRSASSRALRKPSVSTTVAARSAAVPT
jgi:hypothetical protein